MKAKSILLIFLILACWRMSAQEAGKLQAETNIPRPGDEVIKLEASYLSPGEAGKNMVWNFSELNRTGKEYPVNYSSTGENNITSIENSTYFRYRFSGDSLSITGYENASILVKYQQPALIIKFPLSYNTKTSSTFYGKGKYCDRLEYLFSGEIETSVDGYGKLVLPGEDTLSNVMRVHIKQKITDHYQPLDSEFDLNLPFALNEITDTLQKSLDKNGTIETDIYQWYAEGSRYPVLETMKSRRVNTGTHTDLVLTRTAWLFHPEDQKLLPEDQANAILRKNQSKLKSTALSTGLQEVQTQLNVIAYPNPVKDNLQVSTQLQGKTNVQLFLYDMQGRLVYKGPQQQTDGYFSESVRMGNLPQGNYVLRVQAGNTSERKVIVKR